MPKKSDIVEGKIEKVLFPNVGVMHLEENIPVYVKGAYKNQLVSARLLKKKKGIWQAQLIDELENPSYFIASDCTHFKQCGGCAMRHIPYDMQLNLKHSQVIDLIKEAQVSDFEDLGIVSSPNLLDYRNKMEFSFGDAYKGGPMTLGMHRKNTTFDVLTVEGCMIASQDFSLLLRCVLDYCIENQLPYYKKLSHEGYMRYLVIRQSKTTGDILVNIVTSTQMQHDFSALVQRMQNLALEGNIKGVLHTYTDTLADAIKPDTIKLIFGEDFITEKILGLTFKISPFSFFQTNTLGADMLYKKALDLIEEIDNKTVFDLYCGTGTITQIMATKAKKVYGIEIVEEAVVKARENAALNGLSNCTFITGDVLTEVDKLTDKPDIIVLDPPREGIHPKAIQKIIDFKAKELVYISCKPTSLVRDLPIFEEAGYKVKKLMCVDMFPHTVHVETVVLMCASSEAGKC